MSDYYYQQFIQLPEEERQARLEMKRAQVKRQKRDKRGRFTKLRERGILGQRILQDHALKE